ncbi:hypothetical protein ACW9HQ_52410, partial [Nocardia gipuzkoensis]
MRAVLRRGRHVIALAAVVAAILLPVPSAIHFAPTSLFDADSGTQLRISRTVARWFRPGEIRPSDARYLRSVEIGKMTPYEQRGGDVSIPAVRADLRGAVGRLHEEAPGFRCVSDAFD